MTLKTYYDMRAPEYDDWYLGLGLFESRIRPGWHEDLAALQRAIAGLPAARTLDVACGTAFLSRHLCGELTVLDQSEQMLAIARDRVPAGAFLEGDALDRLPFDDDAFDRVFTGHFYGHLEPTDRERFVSEARRVAPELIVADSAVRPDHGREEWQVRTLNSGTRHRVFKRYFDGEELARELGGEVLLSTPWFVVVRA